MKILALIPARQGSKSLPDKNIKLLNGLPLIAHSINHAKQSKLINRIIVSTDSESYAKISINNGAEVPFIRPIHLAQDKSLDFEVFEHALDFLRVNGGYIPDYVVHLRPTHPFRNVDEIDNMIRIISKDPSVDSIRSLTPSPYSSFKMWKMNKDHFIFPVDDSISEAYNMPRQLLPPIYIQNASIDVIKTETITEKKSMTGNKILGYLMDNFFDIDTPEEFALVSNVISSLSSSKRYVFDIDGIIASLVENNDYSLANPIVENIELINSLYDNGNTIVLFTARGYKTGIDWSKITEIQLNNWGLKYHELIFGKPNADFYIDDKMINIELLKQAKKMKVKK